MILKKSKNPQRFCVNASCKKDFHFSSIQLLSYIFTGFEEIALSGMANIIKHVLAAGTVLDIHIHYLIKPPFYDGTAHK